ncbi:hypothetical protein H4O09_12495 [Stenotrophomonas sp. W1S232]|uniref:Lipoprotein n=1 Tax=Stenotrophomonas koreensis TaxID=266128 RepID=A0A7W3V1U8_9GAMM|nr:hypothetical protein [Stenotrophomonas koreensis]MBB1117870.1 hypothetical protein [Stenotrophomonas koreensis]
MKKITIFLALTASATGCTSNTSEHADEIYSREINELVEFEITNNTPDNTLRSHWELLDKTNKIRFSSRYAMDADKAAIEIERKMLATPITTSISATEYERRITEIQHQTASRVVILATVRNISKIPEGSTPTEVQELERKEGVQFKYILEEGRDGWKISEKWYLTKGINGYKDPEWIMYHPDQYTPYPSTVWSIYN